MNLFRMYWMGLRIEPCWTPLKKKELTSCTAAEDERGSKWYIQQQKGFLFQFSAGVILSPHKMDPFELG